MFRNLLFVLFIFFCIRCNAQIHTGLKVFREFDSSRIFDTLEQSPMHQRPVRIDLFYPSASQVKVKPYQFGELMNMYSQRMDYYVTDDSSKKVTNEIAQAVASYLQLNSPDSLLHFETGIYPGCHCLLENTR